MTVDCEFGQKNRDSKSNSNSVHVENESSVESDITFSMQGYYCLFEMIAFILN